MDPPKSPEEAEGGKPPKKKQKKNAPTRSMTAKNFGSILDVGKIKKASRLVIGWRVRHSFKRPVS